MGAAPNSGKRTSRQGGLGPGFAVSRCLTPPSFPSEADPDRLRGHLLAKE
jgi:hypothetical protein